MFQYKYTPFERASVKKHVKCNVLFALTNHFSHTYSQAALVSNNIIYFIRVLKFRESCTCGESYCILYKFSQYTCR